MDAEETAPVAQDVPVRDGLHAYRRVTIYRDDATTPVVYEPVKHVWWEAGNSIFVVSFIIDLDTGAHDYAHWPRERIAWIREEKLR